MLGFFKRRNHWRTHFERGMSAGSVGDLLTASRHFSKAAGIAPDEPYPHYEFGYTLFLLGHYTEALDELRRADELSPGFFLVQTEILLCEAMLSGSLEPQNLARIRQLQRLADQGQSESPDAVSLSRQVIESDQEFPLGHYFLGKALFASDRPRSESAFERCLDLCPDDTTAIDALTHIGLLREAAGDADSARRIWEDVMSRYEGNPHTELTRMILIRNRSAQS